MRPSRNLRHVSNHSRVVIVGSAGLFGSALADVLGERAIRLTRRDCDVRQPLNVDMARLAGASHVVNTAAFIDVDACERNREEAFSVNCLGAWNVAKLSAALNAKTVFISTDSVFDGNQSRAYIESDRIAPQNVYGASKAAGEFMTQTADSSALIVRTSQLFGLPVPGQARRPNIVERVLGQAASGLPLKAATDMVFSPTSTADLARSLVDAIDRSVSGVLHLTNEGSCTREEFTRFVLDTAGVRATVIPLRLRDIIPDSAPRPLHTALRSERLAESGLRPLPSWQDAVRGYVATRGQTQ